MATLSCSRNRVTTEMTVVSAKWKTKYTLRTKYNRKLEKRSDATAGASSMLCAKGLCCTYKPCCASARFQITWSGPIPKLAPRWAHKHDKEPALFPSSSGYFPSGDRRKADGDRYPVPRCWVFEPFVTDWNMCFFFPI
jgi:hypothetical protein